MKTKLMPDQLAEEKVTQKTSYRRADCCINCKNMERIGKIQFCRKVKAEVHIDGICNKYNDD